MTDGIDLTEKLSTFSEHWSPRTVAQFNACDVMVVKVEGEFVWHKHDDTDDFFLVLKGHLDIELRDRTVSLGPGQMFIGRRASPRRARGSAPAADRTDRHAEHGRCENGGGTQACLNGRERRSASTAAVDEQRDRFAILLVHCRPVDRGIDRE